MVPSTSIYIYALTLGKVPFLYSANIPILLFHFSLYPNISGSGQPNLLDVYLRAQPRLSNVFADVLQLNFVAICLSLLLSNTFEKRSLSHLAFCMNIFVKESTKFYRNVSLFLLSRHFSKELLIFLYFH